MSDQTAYASIAETIHDCRAILSYIRKHNLTDVRIITLSLEAYRYLLQKSKVENLHIWKLLDMETLLFQAYLDASAAAAEWVKEFSDDEDNLYDEAVQTELHLYVFYHSFVCVRVIEGLKPLFLREGWSYLVPSLRCIWLSRYYPHFQKNNTRNFVFKAISADILNRAGIHVQHVMKTNWLNVNWLPFDLFCSAARRIAKDVAIIIRGILFRTPTIDNRLIDIRDSVDVLISGWGSDISRMISFTELKHHSEQYSQFTILNTIWRPAKIAAFEQIHQNSSNFNSVLIDEEVSQGMAHGPKLSLFPRGEQVSTLINYIMLVAKRLYGFWQWSHASSKSGELQFVHIRLNALWTIFFAYRHAFLHGRLFGHLFSKLSPSYYVGSNSDLAGMRAEQLSARQLGAATLSIPHGYQVWAYPAHHYLADIVLTHGQATKKLLSTSIPEQRIRIIGNSHLVQEKVPKLSGPIRVVIATRSWGGLWSNFGSRHDEYDIQLMALLRSLNTDSQFDVVIKSHPNGDYHAYYDLVANSFSSKRLRHVSKGWKLETFLSSCDVLVCLGEVPSFFISAQMVNIPVVFIKGVMTKTQAYLHYNYEGGCQVVEDYQSAVEVIKRITSDQEFRLQLLKRQKEFVAGYKTENPEKRLMAQLAHLLQEKNKYNSSIH